MTSKPNNPDESVNAEKEAYLTNTSDTAESEDWAKEKIKHEKKRKAKKSLIIVLISICTVIAIVISSFFVLNLLGKNKLLNQDVDINANNEDAIIYEDSTILYNGVLYEYNPNVTGILFMGVDREELIESDNIGTNGQADTIILATVDTQTGKTVLTGIPRDTITGIDLYSVSGEFLKTENKQICLAYAYGDGKTTSCENTVKAVCELLHGMPINSYLSADYSLVSKLTDTFGGINVTPNETFDSQKPNYATIYSFQKGKTTKLTGDNALPFLKYRGNNADSSYLRLERQMNYLNNLVDKAIDKTKNDIRFPLTLYNMFSKETVSNLSADKITFITSSIFSNRSAVEIEFKNLEGEQIIGESGYAEFYPDKTKLFELVLELFYQPVTD